MSLDIQGIDLKQDKVKNPIDTRIPTPPFRIIIIAPSFSGKSNLIANIIRSKRFYRGFFKYVHFFSKTFQADRLWVQKFKTSEDFVKDNLDVQYIENIIEFQEKLKENNEPMEHHLFILDDLANEIKDSKNDIITKLFFRGRHHLISTIITAQSYKSLAKNLRTNASALIFFKQANNKEITSIAEENSFDLGNNQFEQLFQHVTNLKAFNFLMIDRQEIDRDKKFRINFDKLIKVENDTFIEEDVDECNCLEKFDKECFNCRYPPEFFREKIPDVTELNKGADLDFGDQKSLRESRDKKKRKKVPVVKLKEIFEEILNNEPLFRGLKKNRKKRFRK